MSSKNRKRESDPFDDYPTPPWVVWQFLEYYGTWPMCRGTVSSHDRRLLEPCAGAGNIIQTFQNYMENVSSGCTAGWGWDAIELQPQYADKLKDLKDVNTYCPQDFLTWNNPDNIRYTAVLTNPPYTLAQKFVEKSLELSDLVIMLLRVGFTGSYDRHPFLRETKPDLYRIVPRPSFKLGGSDSSEYAWFVWSPDSNSKIHYLDPPPDRLAAHEQRKAKKRAKELAKG